MSRPEPSLDETHAAPAQKPAGHLGLWLTRFFWGALVSSAMALVIGFIAFAESAASYDSDESQRVDGIVALTGGSFRIHDAVDILMKRYGRRLLISGVNRLVGPKEIAQLVPGSATLFSCCIDLDYRALNTRGNAIQAAAWARRNGFHTVMIVTSRWHAPRTRLEMEREAPDLRVVIHPVSDSRFRPEDWWRHPDSIKVLGMEYAKYLLAIAKIRLEQAIDHKADPKHPAEPA